MAVIILDRDGVINYDSPNYIKSPEEWLPLPGAIEAIALLSKAGNAVYIATNQAGLARDKFSLESLEAMHQKLLTLVDKQGGKIAGIFYCPHHPDENCNCRKPETGLLEQIQSHYQQPVKEAYFVGDSLKDIQAALAMACHPVLVETGNGIKTKLELKTELKSEEIEKIECHLDLMAFTLSYLKH